MIECDGCGNKFITLYKDYRFMEEYGFQGKCLMCETCRRLSDYAIVDMVRRRK